MLVEDWRPQLYCKDVACDNMSPNGNVFFIDEGHYYYHKDDIVNGKPVTFDDSTYRFRSPTGIIKDMHEEFDTIPEAKKYVKKHKLPITWKQLVYGWEFLGDYASDQGTILHAYGESMFNKWPMPKPKLLKALHVDKLYNELNRKYVLAKTELLVYSTHLRLAGQVDLLMKNYDASEYYLFDYKFLKEPLEMKSYYNRYTRKYKMMYGPFNRLMDCNHNHYSVQMEIYRYLMGALGKKVRKKQLMVVTPDGYELVDGKPMKIWVDVDGGLQARYKQYGDKIYDSSRDRSYMENPYRII